MSEPGQTLPRSSWSSEPNNPGTKTRTSGKELTSSQVVNVAPTINTTQQCLLKRNFVGVHASHSCEAKKLGSAWWNGDPKENDPKCQFSVVDNSCPDRDLNYGAQGLKLTCVFANHERLVNVRFHVASSGLCRASGVVRYWGPSRPTPWPMRCRLMSRKRTSSGRESGSCN